MFLSPYESFLVVIFVVDVETTSLKRPTKLNIRKTFNRRRGVKPSYEPKGERLHILKQCVIDNYCRVTSSRNPLHQKWEFSFSLFILYYLVMGCPLIYSDHCPLLATIACRFHSSVTSRLLSRKMLMEWV